MMRCRVLMLLLMCVGGALFVFSARAQDENGANAALVEQVRVGQDGTRTRLVLEFAKDAPQAAAGFRWFTLPKPTRVVLDFSEIAFKTPPSLVPLPPTSLVKGMRAGRFRPGTVRMVLDLQKAARVNVFGIPGNADKGARVVMDVVELKPGQKPTDVPPPQDVVDAGKAADAQVREQVERKDEAPVVPRQVVKNRRDRMVVVLDAGHGGVDPGACGRRLNLCEKGLTLTMVKLVQERLESDRIEVILTRDSDVYIPLPDRPRVAQKHNADLFVSLHADIHPTDRSVRGATVYMVSEKASDREAARLADSENAGDLLAGVGLERENAEVRNILISLVQRDTLNNSVYLGQAILGKMDEVTEVRKKSLLSAGFRVLKAPDVPSVLVEMGYLSNPVEEEQLSNARFRSKLADSIARGIKDYLAAHVHY